jgi:lysozyme
MIKGVDVYAGDNEINWAKVKNTGYDFAFIKATQGTSIKDIQYKTNIQNAQYNNLLTGSYHFFEATGNASDQAKYFLDYVGDMNGQLLPVLDAERKGGMTVAQYSRSVQAWLDVVENAIGKKPIIYVNNDYAINSLTHTFREYPLWLAHWGESKPSGKIGGWDKWVWWQNSANATVDGLPNIGGADTDYFDGTIEQLRTYLIEGPTTTQIQVIDHAQGNVIETLQMVLNGDHIVDQKKLYVRKN